MNAITNVRRRLGATATPPPAPPPAPEPQPLRPDDRRVDGRVTWAVVGGPVMCDACGHWHWGWAEPTGDYVARWDYCDRCPCAVIP